MRDAGEGTFSNKFHVTRRCRLVSFLGFCCGVLLSLFQTASIADRYQGLVTVPFWEYWTSPYSSHYRPYT